MATGKQIHTQHKLGESISLAKRSHNSESKLSLENRGIAYGTEISGKLIQHPNLCINLDVYIFF